MVKGFSHDKHVAFSGLYTGLLVQLCGKLIYVAMDRIVIQVSGFIRGVDG